MTWEGIVSKRSDVPYRSERSEAWLKGKTVQKESFPLVGFIKDPSGVAALHRGKREGNELVYMGKAGQAGSHCLQPNPQAARYCHQSQIEIDEAYPQAKVDPG